MDIRLKKNNSVITTNINYILTNLKFIKSILNAYNFNCESIILKHYLIVLYIIKRSSVKNNILLIHNLKVKSIKQFKCEPIRNVKFYNIELLSIMFQTLFENLNRKNIIKPFWTPQHTEFSKKLWFPTNILLPSNDITNTCIRTETEINPWTSVVENINKINDFKFINGKNINFNKDIEPEFIEYEKTKCFILKLNPSKSQISLFNNWRGTTRHIYNKALYALKNNEIKPKFYDLRDKFVSYKVKSRDENGKVIKSSKAERNLTVEDWEILTPKDIRAGTMLELATAYKSAFTNLKNGNIRNFNLQFKKKKSNLPLTIPPTTIKLLNTNIDVYPNIINKNKKSNSQFNKYLKSKINCNVKQLKKLKSITEEIKRECKIVENRGKWYLHVPITVKVKQSKPKYQECAIDQGIVNFIVIYSKQKTVKVIADRSSIASLHKKLDELKSKRALHKISKSKYERRFNKISFHIDNLINELHFKTRNYVVNNFKSIVLPPFESQNMVIGNLRRQTKRELMNFKPYLFKCRLKESITNYHKLIVNSEEYTSQTCTSCGYLTAYCTDRVFKCNACKFTIDRDVNAARNIFVKSYV